MPQKLSQQALSDVQAATFTPIGYSKAINFNAQLTEWNDTRKPRIAYHEYLKRDGGEAEYMGRAPHSVRMNLVFVGPNWRKDFTALQIAIDTSPLGTLVHPFFGSMQVCCEGIDGAAVNIADALDTVVIPIAFRESNLNQKLSGPLSVGPPFYESQVSQFTTRLQAATAAYLGAQLLVEGFLLAVNTFASAATASTFASSSTDPTLPQKLASVGTTATAARNAIRVDRAATDDVATFDAIRSIEQMTDLCNQLANSVRNLKPVLAPYAVPAQATLLAIAQKFYGRDAMTRLSEITTNNIGKIPNPAAVPVGTVLMLASATVVELQ